MDSTLANKAGFSNLYGDYSLDYPAINSFGDIEAKYMYAKYFGLALIVIGVLALISYKLKSDKDGKNKKKKSKSSKTLLILGAVGLFLGGGMFLYYFYAYFYLYLPQYRNFYSDLPEEATELLKTF